MLKYLPIRLLWHSLNWLTRLTIVASAVLAVLTALAILMLRYWLLPNVEQYHDRIVASLSGAIGNPVTIGRIEGDWMGFRPRLSFDDVHIISEQRQSELVLPRIDGSVSWMSLFAGELRLASLEIDRPELLIRRDARGMIFVGGVALSKQGSNNDLSDWLLRQSRMVARDALVIWVDEQREAPTLVLQQVNLHIESLFSHHRFALHAVSPTGLSTPLDIRGDFYGTSFDDLNAWRGRMFTQIDYTDVTAWRPWLDLPGEFSSGRGALRGWLDIEGGKVTGVIADLGLRDVVTRLAEDVPEMTLLDLRGRAAWKEVAGGMEVSTRRLAMRLQNGLKLQPTDFHFRTTKAANGQSTTSELSANLLQLESLAGLSDFMPLEAGLRAKLDAYAPRGRVSNLNAQWQGAPDKNGDYKITGYKIKGQFEDLALRQVGKLPGFSGLSAEVDGSDEGGRLHVDSRQLMVDAPDVMREPLLFSTLTGQAGWQRKRGELLVKVDNVAVANDDLAGNLYGSYQTRAGTLGMLDLTVSLTRGDVRSAARYTPLVALDREDSDWLDGAMLAGHTEDFRVRVKGNLSDFPLDGTEDALLEIGGHARGVAMEFDKDWPRIENISGEFWIRGNKMEVKSPSATMLDAHLQNLTVTIADLQSDDLLLEIKGNAAGASNTFLRFIQQSPVRGYIDGFTDGMSARGDGHLGLSLHIPLGGTTRCADASGAGVPPTNLLPQTAGCASNVSEAGVDKPVKVSGTFRVQDNDVNLGDGVPLLRKTRGELSFTESGVQARGVSAEILGGASSIDVKTEPGGVMHVTAKGRSNLDVLRRINPHPLLNHLSGSAAWDADIAVVKKAAQLTINSDLRGLGSNLPQPFAKSANEAMPLRLEKKNVAEGQDVILLQLGKLLSVRLARRDQNGAMAIRRGTINFGGENIPASQSSRSGTRRLQEQLLGAGATGGALRNRNGIWLSGSLPELSLQGWGDLLGSAGGMEGGLPIAGANLSIAKVSGFGMHIDNLSIDANKRGDGLLAQLSSSALNGEVEWQPRGEGKLTARLKNLLLSGDDAAAAVPAPAAQPVQPATVSPGDLPAMQVAVEHFQVAGKQVGRLELVGHPDGEDWRLRRLNIVNPDGSLVGDGVWRGVQGGAQTQVNLLLQISDAGKILARSGYPNTVKGGSGKLAANLSWDGNPGEFSYATLDGSLKLDTSKGQFLKMEPGIGKLLGILSLQALPKRITLDFTDVFSDGFQFDNINGNASIKNGVIDTQDFYIDGSSAKVAMKGSVDLNNETQNLHVQILPTLGDSVSLLGAFAAGPVAGIGSLLINKVLGNPLDKLASFEYNVSGTWGDPQVTKVGKAPVKVQQHNHDE